MAPDELAIIIKLRRVLGALEPQQALELLLDKLKKTRNNVEFLMQIQKTTLGPGRTETPRVRPGAPIGDTRRPSPRRAPGIPAERARRSTTRAPTNRLPKKRRHEARHPPRLRRDHRDLRLRQHVHHPQHVADRSLTAEVCSACHPFYTGKQKILDTGGRVARFEKRFGKRAAPAPSTADK